MTTYVPPKKNTAYVCYVTLVSQANVLVFQSNPTLAAGDVKVSIDGGALTNLTTLPVVTPAASKLVKVSLSAAEMNGDNIAVVFSDAAGAEWCDQLLILQTAARQMDDLSTLGAGAITFTYTLTNVADATPIADANVWATTDSAGANVVASGITNSLGQVTFYLDAGAIYIWRQKDGWVFSNPDSETVA